MSQPLANCDARQTTFTIAAGCGPQTLLAPTATGLANRKTVGSQARCGPRQVQLATTAHCPFANRPPIT
eukprot:1348935-Lingulodinium_polyedra.AAC.1